MKINLEFDDNDVIHQFMDGMFLLMLKNALKRDKEYLSGTQFIHEDDKMQYKYNIAAYKHLIEYYSESSEDYDD